jgi:hypothetical protein
MAISRICSIPGCGKPVRTLKSGLCCGHEKRLKRHGDPLIGRTPVGTPLKWIEENASHVGDECLTWPFSRTQAGYGDINVEGKRHLASRIMCIVAHGEPPTEQHQTAHNCGNGHLGCVNPRHLRWATPVENNADKAEHGTVNNGERNGAAKLTEYEVREIRRLKPNCSYRSLGEMFGITAATACDVVKRRSWAWLD